ncbi:hypothetical protein ACKF40_004373, partial [Pseudomonas aeruginosa]
MEISGSRVGRKLCCMNIQLSSGGDEWKAGRRRSGRVSGGTGKKCSPWRALLRICYSKLNLFRIYMILLGNFF